MEFFLYFYTIRRRSFIYLNPPTQVGNYFTSVGNTPTP